MEDARESESAPSSKEERRNKNSEGNLVKLNGGRENSGYFLPLIVPSLYSRHATMQLPPRLHGSRRITTRPSQGPGLEWFSHIREGARCEEQSLGFDASSQEEHTGLGVM